MTAIKWYLLSYRLHFNQISLNYTVVNAQSTVPNAVNCAECTVNCAECTVNCAERTVNCALDIVNRMMFYILYLSLRWLHEVGSWTIAISVMTAIKWCLFSYRLHFNQISLNYKVANAQSTVPNAQPTVHWTLLTEWCLTSYISVYDGRMKLRVVILWSVWNDSYQMISI